MSETPLTAADLERLRGLLAARDAANDAEEAWLASNAPGKNANEGRELWRVLGLASDALKDTLAEHAAALLDAAALGLAWKEATTVDRDRRPEAAGIWFYRPLSSPASSFLMEVVNMVDGEACFQTLHPDDGWQWTPVRDFGHFIGATWGRRPLPLGEVRP